MITKSVYNEIFDDQLIVKRIRNKLPRLLQLAELESSRNGKIGMEIGSVRERILIALLMYKYGIDIVNSQIRITEPEIDVFVKDQPLSIKTISTPSIKLRDGVKLIWTVDAQKAANFKNEYNPQCDMLLLQIVWKKTGRMLLFSRESQGRILEQIGRDRYIKLPKEGTNPRGVEITGKALELLADCEDTRILDIEFKREEIDCREIYTKWLDAWREEY